MVGATQISVPIKMIYLSLGFEAQDIGLFACRAAFVVVLRLAWVQRWCMVEEPGGAHLLDLWLPSWSMASVVSREMSPNNTSVERENVK